MQTEKHPPYNVPPLSTVKSKTSPTAAPTAAPSAAASSAPASQAPASAVPSDAASAVPSDAASAAPSDDASAAPSADVSAEPSAEPSKEPSKVSEIKILNETALTNEKGTEAYIYYDVVDQYGESMRTTTDIQWTTSPANKSVDKVLGKITVKKDAAKAGQNQETFTYGQQIFVNGVHVKTGTVKQASVTVGMAQAVDSIKLEGFVDKNDPTNIIQSLPKNFAKDTYYLLFQTFDQNGCPLDVTDEEFGAKNLTFVPDNPLLLTIEKDDAKQFFTVKGVDYAAVAVKPGDYVNKGGETNILVVANKTGNKNTINIVVGAMAQLKSLELSSPKETVADGDAWVEIPYVAKDTEGNTVTNYETIVRSNNSLSLSASDNTTLVVKEKNDGTAGIYWTDDQNTYNPTDSTATGTYSKSNVSDGLDRMVALTTIVVGGESNNFMLSVSDIRIPSTITGVKDDNLKDYMADQNDVTLKVTSDTNFSFKDQYGKEMARNPVDGQNAAANAFFTYAGSNKFADNYYGIKVDGTTDAKYGVPDLSIIKAGEFVTVTPKAKFESNEWVTDEATLKFSIAKSETLSPSGGAKDWNDTSKIWPKTVYAVPVTELAKSAKISGLDSTIEVSVTGEDVATNASPSAITVVNRWGGANECEYKVIGTYKNNDVQIPFGKGFISEGTGSFFTISDANAISGAIHVSVTEDGKTKDIVTSDLFDTMKFGYPAKDKSLEAVFAISGEKSDGSAATGGAVTAKVRKDVTVRAEEAVVTSLKFTTATGTLNPRGTSMQNAARNASLNGYDVGWNDKYHACGWGDNTEMSTGPVVYCNQSWAHPNVPLFATYDQYGHPIKADVVYTISDLKESTDEFAHVSGNAKIVDNGTATAYVDGAEIGDTFKVTAKVKGTTISDSCTVTVGADTLAYIANGNKSDETFRTGKLGFVK